MRKAKSSAAPLHNFCGLVHISEELFPAAVQSLNFAAGETVEAGEFAVTIPEGLHYTRTENPETRLFTAIPREIPFDAEDFWAYSAVALTLQTGAPIVNIHAPLDTADGEKEVELILQSLSISDSSSAGQTAAGKTTRAARSPDHYICYELIDDNDVDMNFRYYVFTKSFLYAGQYVGKKAGLGPDCSKTHTGLLETYLQGFRYTGGGEKLLEDAGRRALGRYAGSDGRMDALKAVQLFNLEIQPIACSFVYCGSVFGHLRGGAVSARFFARKASTRHFSACQVYGAKSHTAAHRPEHRLICRIAGYSHLSIPSSSPLSK